ncbi:hypothetical protein [Actinomadura sp. 6N118]|uniref:hypothetical protein n=1 Tax=Actinomadura sp. 6N118 TaxID=3375151 RepID=UPI00379A57E0
MKRKAALVFGSAAVAVLITGGQAQADHVCTKNITDTGAGTVGQVRFYTEGDVFHLYDLNCNDGRGIRGEWKYAGESVWRHFGSHTQGCTNNPQRYTDGNLQEDGIINIRARRTGGAWTSMNCRNHNT